ncbi:MAG: AEC family transporter [Lachnospiraceae bacterium]|nr:AEC family transporter [Lachnospiraceae bacterium]
MSISVVLEQMVIIMILITVGIFLFRKKMLSEDTSRQLSGLIVNITNPAVLICSAFDDAPKASLSELALGLGVVFISYIALLAAAYLIPLLLRVPKPGRYSYRMLTVFGNVGFIGIPLVSAVLGTSALIFVSLNNLVYNILVYTYGISTLRKASIEQRSTEALSAGASGQEAAGSENIFHKLVNAGTVSAVLTIFFYLADFNVPTIISSSLSSAGRTTTFLSMLVLGVSVAQMAPKKIFSNRRLYVFTLIRQILLPIGLTLLLGIFVKNPLIVNSAALMLAVPAGNMPLMLSKQLHVDESVISQGIILTTILSLATIPLVTLFIA